VTERELFELPAGYAADFVETLDVRLIRPEAVVAAGVRA
jgi:hypothetical protein